MKLTLTRDDQRRVNRVMGSTPTDSHGRRRCRCGELVPHTPNDLWQHTLACEKQQQRDACAAAAARQHAEQVLEMAGMR